MGRLDASSVKPYQMIVLKVLHLQRETEAMGRMKEYVTSFGGGHAYPLQLEQEWPRNFHLVPRNQLYSDLRVLRRIVRHIYYFLESATSV